MKQNRLYTIISGFLAIWMLLAPMAPLVYSQTVSAGQVSASASTYNQEKYAGVLQDAAHKTPELQRYLDQKRLLYHEMLSCTELWAKVLEEKGAQSEQPKLLAIAKEFGQRFGETVRKADAFSLQITESLTRLGVTNGQFSLNSSSGSLQMATLLECQLNVGLYDNLDSMVNRLWDGFIASQLLPLRPDQLDQTQSRQLLDAQAGVTAKIREVNKLNADWQANWALLVSKEIPEAQTINFAYEVKLLKAATRLADEASVALKGKADETSKAHSQMLERYRRVLLEKSESLQELTGNRDPQLLSESFLHAADAGKVSGEWLKFAERQNGIITLLKDGLQAKSTALDKLIPVAEQLVIEAQDTAQAMHGKSTGNAATDLALQKVLNEAVKNIRVSQDSLQSLNASRKQLAEKLESIGSAKDIQSILGDGREAMIYDQLGQTYGFFDAALLQVSEYSGVIARAAGILQAGEATTGKNAFVDKRTDFEVAFGGFKQTLANDQSVLERYRQLNIDVLAKYDATVAAASSQFSEVVSASSQSIYLPVLRQMSALFKQEATQVVGLTTPMLQAVSGSSPKLGMPQLSWKGTSTLGNALTTLIEQGAYLDRLAIPDVSALSKNGDGSSFHDSLRIVDLAIALHYPIRTFVNANGMTLVLGIQGPGVVICGIGNVEKYSLKEGTAHVLPPDFLLNGYAIGWDFGGAFHNFCDDIGANFNSAVSEAAKNLNNVGNGLSQIGAQVVQDVATISNALDKASYEIGKFELETAGDLGSSFVKNPFKIVGYIGVGLALGAATIATGGVCAPVLIAAVAYAASDVGNSAVNVAQNEHMISAQQAGWAHFGFDVSQTVAGFATGIGAAGALANAAGTTAAMNAGQLVNLGGGLAGNIVDLAEREKWINDATSAWLKFGSSGISLGGSIVDAKSATAGLNQLAEFSHNLNGYQQGFISDAQIFTDSVGKFAEYTGGLEDYGDFVADLAETVISSLPSSQAPVSSTSGANSGALPVANQGNGNQTVGGGAGTR